MRLFSGHDGKELLFRIHFVNCSSSEKDFVLGLDKPNIYNNNHPETLGLI